MFFVHRVRDLQTSAEFGILVICTEKRGISRTIRSFRFVSFRPRNGVDPKNKFDNVDGCVIRGDLL